MNRRSQRTRWVAGIAAVAIIGAGVWTALPGSTPRTSLAGMLNYRECFQGDVPSPQVIALGDSITAGHTNPLLNLRASDAYADILACDGMEVRNAGVKGQTTAEMLDRLPQDVLEHEPDEVVILGGTNDLRLGRGTEIVDNLERMTDELQGQGVGVAIGLLPPNDKLPAETIAANNEIREWASSRDVSVLDFWTPMSTDQGTYKPGLSEDGTHPTPEGAAVMAEVASR